MSEILLAARGLAAGYHGHPIVPNLDLEVRAGEVVALLGPNGAGKTTTLLTLAGELRPLGGDVFLYGESVRSPLYKRARQGLGFVSEERSVFTQRTVRENLRVAGCSRERVLKLFPELEPLLGRRAGLLSGGEQQMLTLGRALAREPRVLLLDELSLGLAPLIVVRLLAAVRAAADDQGVAVLLVEQHVNHALRMADRAYVLRRGQVVLEGTSRDVAHRLKDTYLTGESPTAPGSDRNGHSGILA